MDMEPMWITQAPRHGPSTRDYFIGQMFNTHCQRFRLRIKWFAKAGHWSLVPRRSSPHSGNDATMPFTPAQIQRINQAKMNGLCGKVMHARALKGARFRSQVVDYAGAAVPIVLLVMTVVVLRLHAPELAFVIVADIVGAVVLLAILLKVFLKWQERYEDHLKMLHEDLQIAREADTLLGRKDTASGEVAELFLQRASELDKEDIQIFGEVTEELRRECYRLALREMGRDATCQCGASPWNYQPGACQVCGGTPVSSAKEPKHAECGG
jgi:mobilome CxxCx(11)CxxC protein